MHSFSSEFGWYGRTVTFLVRNSITNKTERGDSSLWCGKIPPNSMFCFVRAAHFSSVSIWCKCCNAGLRFLFKVKTLNVLLCGSWNNDQLAFERNCFLVGRFFRLDFCYCFLVRTAEPTSYNMWLSLTEICSIFQGCILINVRRDAKYADYNLF